MGRLLRARSVLHCHGVLALRDRSLTGVLQEESQLQGGASKLAAGSAKGRAKINLSQVSGT